jgi:TolB-like protein/DNA-binding winged helix-turn-helix (wHTH) protein/Flp pilus assembly protein TadD
MQDPDILPFSGVQTSVATSAKSDVIGFGVYEFHVVTRELRKHGMRIRLEGQPLIILEMLLERPGELVTREELRNKLWPGETFVDFEHSLNAGVKRLRAVLGDSAGQPRYIETQARRGYRFIAPLDRVGALAQELANVPPASVQRAQPALTARRWWIIAAIALCIAGLLGWGWHRWPGRSVAAPVPVIRSLAVLPLANLSGDPSQEYFADGMTEELIGRLSMIRGLRVISRTSVMQFKSTKPSVPETAKMLHVDGIVEGSVMREGDHVRVHAQLINAATDQHIWSESYDRDLSDTLALESEVAQSIARKVEITITGEERSRLVGAREVAPDVYESYLKGRGAVARANSRAEIEKSVTYFEEAITKDATFAPAYVGLASAYEKLGTGFVGAMPPGFARQKVFSAASKALELDPNLAEAHAQLAFVYMEYWQWRDAEAEYRRALELSPNDAAAYRGFGAGWLMLQGRMDEALAMSRRALELDPLGESGTELGWVLFHARRYDEAIRELRSVMAVRPDDAEARNVLGRALICNDQAEEAIPLFGKADSMTGHSPGSVQGLAMAYARAGRRTEAVRLIDELRQRQKTTYVPPAIFVYPYLELGDYDQAFAFLERAYREQANILMFLRVSPFFDPVRNDPRFKDLLRRVGLN